MDTDALVANGEVYTTAGSTMYAINLSTGTQVWNYTDHASFQPSYWFGPLTSANGVVYGDTLYGIYALNGTTGAELDLYCTVGLGTGVCNGGEGAPILAS